MREGQGEIKDCADLSEVTAKGLMVTQGCPSLSHTHTHSLSLSFSVQSLLRLQLCILLLTTTIGLVVKALRVEDPSAIPSFLMGIFPGQVIPMT